MKPIYCWLFLVIATAISSGGVALAARWRCDRDAEMTVRSNDRNIVGGLIDRVVAVATDTELAGRIYKAKALYMELWQWKEHGRSRFERQLAADLLLILDQLVPELVDQQKRLQMR